MKLYKLTDENGQTYGGCQWGEGVTHETNGAGELCGPGWLHAYTSPLLAVLLNRIHANFKNPQLWEAEGEIEKEDRGLKVGTTKLATVKRVPLPEITTEQRVRFAILVAQEVIGERCPAWVEWAKGWLSGKDRSKNAANAAYAAANAAADAAAYAAADAAADAAYAAVYAATHAAADAADAAYAAAYATTHAATHAATAATHAANAAYAAANAALNRKTLDLIAIAEEACR